MAPYYAIELQPNYDFEQFSINCVPLTWLAYNIDTRKVHQLIQGFVQIETTDTWVNPKERKQDGRLEYLALLSCYGGEVNKAVRIKKSEALRTLLIYNNERAMSFEKFFTNM